MNKAHAEICSSAEWADRLRTHTLPWAREGVHLPGTLLEIGPGYGAATEVLRREVDRLIAVEKDPELAAQLAATYQGVPGLDIRQGDATHLDLEDDSVGGATCYTMLHHVPSAELQDRLFAEARRVVRPGGWFFGVDSLGGPRFQRLHEDDVCVVVDPLTLAARLEAAGFEQIEVAVLAMGVRFHGMVPA